MDYNEFKEMLINKIQGKMQRKAKIHIETIEVINDVKKEAIVFAGNDKAILFQRIYLDNLYEMYMSGIGLDICADTAIATYRETPDLKIEKILKSWKEVKTKLDPVVMNKEWNKEILKNIPYKEKLDLAICCRVILKQNDGKFFSVTVRKNMIDQWGITEEEFWEAVRDCFQKNDYSITSINDLLRDQYYEQDGKDLMDNPEMQTQLYVMTNAYHNWGAAGFFRADLLKEFSEELKMDLYVLPSSIHEIILMPADGNADKNYLKKMVETINEGCVERKEWLSNQVYYYSREKEKVEIAAD